MFSPPALDAPLDLGIGITSAVSSVSHVYPSDLHGMSEMNDLLSSRTRKSEIRI
jgi:hypothetical protein